MGVQSLSVSYLRARRSEGIRPTTLGLYRDCLTRLSRFMAAEVGDDGLERLTPRLLTDYFGVRLETCSQTTVWTDAKAVRTFTKWLLSEGEVATDPMTRVKTPKQASKPVPVLSLEDLRRLVAACEGRQRRDVRDACAMRLLIEGLRRGEVCGLKPSDVDLDRGEVTVTGKGKTRTVAVGSKTVMSLDRWIRAGGGSSPLLLDLTPSGLYQAMRARAEMAGVENFHPHRLRHTAAHRWLVAGGNEGDLMESLGWSSPSMLRRYGVSAAAERARAAQRHLALSDGV